jgi:hypothetical protein
VSVLKKSTPACAEGDDNYDGQLAWINFRKVTLRSHAEGDKWLVDNKRVGTGWSSLAKEEAGKAALNAMQRIFSITHTVGITAFCFVFVTFVGVCWTVCLLLHVA